MSYATSLAKLDPTTGLFAAAGELGSVHLTLRSAAAFFNLFLVTKRSPGICLRSSWNFKAPQRRP